MKTLFSMMAGTLITVTAAAQATSGTLTIKLMGNKQRTVLVDGISYNAVIQTGNSTRPQSLITIPGLTAGQHTLTVQTAATGNRAATTANTTFTLRSGYDLTITIANNGTVQTSESRSRNRGSQVVIVPMSNTAFNALYSNVQRTRGNNAKATLINTALTTGNNYFTSYQVAQLLRQLTSEASRLQMAKTAYRIITDPAAFTQVTALLTSTAARNDLAAYVAANPNTNNSVVYNNTSSGSYNARNFTPMSEANYQSLYNSIQNHYYANERVTDLRAVFANTGNYFTSYQAKNLIALATDESIRLELAKAAYRSVSDPANFSVMNDLLNLQYNRDALAAYIASYAGGNANANTGVSYRTPVSEAGFNTIYTDVQRAWNTQSKYDAIVRAFTTNGNYFTSAQVKQLIALVGTETLRVELAKRSLPVVTDTDNFPVVYDLISTPSLRTDLQAYAFNYVTTGNGNPAGTGLSITYRTPMSTTDYDALYNSIQKQWIPGSKHSALRSVFANTSYYFTTDQVRRLLLITTEDNRLELAKSAYRNITDPANITALYDVFSTQASRDALAEYVRTYVPQ
jgi:hypothetical protein